MLDREEQRMTKVASFEIHYTQYLDASGEAVAELPGFARDPAALIPLYRAMVLTRRFDAKAIALQRTGRLGTYASSLGQEAVTVGLAAAMRPEDVLLPTYREAGAQLWRGVRLEELLLYWGGDERGSDFQGPRADFPVCVPIASQCLHAVGVAYAKKLKREAGVAVCVCGDGATSNGAFYEAINYAGDEVSGQWAQDPIARLRNHLSAAAVWTKAAEERLIEAINGEIDAAVEH